MRMVWRGAVVMGVVLGAGAAWGNLQYTGVNLSGAEFGSVTGTNRGTYGTDYIYPLHSEVDYFVGKGMNVFRLPFRWERLQPTLNTALNATELGRMDDFVNYAASKGASVIIDPHNFDRYIYSGSTQTVVGSDSTATNAAFGDFWSRLAGHYANNPHVMFNLTNEPHDLGGSLSTTTQRWLATAQAAVTAIRGAGANNLLLIPGNGWTGAWSWTPSSGTTNYYGTANSVVMPGISDPANNYAWDVHQYLDRDNSGTHDEVTNSSGTPDANIGVERLTAITQYLVANHQKAFLGEFAAPNDLVGTASNQIADEAISGMLNYMEANSSAWLGWSWWGGGPWWPGSVGNPTQTPYMFLLDPANLGQANQTDRAAMGVLHSHLARIPGDANSDGRINADDYALVDRGFNAHLSGWGNGDFNGDGVINAADYLILDRAFLASGGTMEAGLVAEREAEFGAGYVAELTAGVPEPGMLGVCGVAMAMGWRRRR